jgi:hypothetical protein
MAEGRLNLAHQESERFLNIKREPAETVTRSQSQTELTGTRQKMPARPWSARASLPPTYACYVTASQQLVRRYRDLPAVLVGLRAADRQLRDSEGLLGYALAVRLWDRTFCIVSAWVDQDAAETAERTAGPGRTRAGRTSVSWFCLAEELPVGWEEVRHRLRHSAHGVIRPGDRVAR